jgi:hypothetical protein
MDLVERAKRILLQPGQEWQAINTEPATTADLYRSYIVPLAAIGPVASIIGMSVVGVSVPFFGTYRVPFGTAVGHAVVSYVLTLVAVYVLALIINALAPTFAAEKNDMQALKVAAYASTAAWLAGVFSLIPVLSVLGILGLYSLYLLYLGLPILMKAPQEKALGYTAVVVVAGIALFAVIGAVSGAFITYPSPTMRIPGMK